LGITEISPDISVIYVPFPITLSDDASAELQDYISNGGKVISEARLAWTNQNGFANEKVPGAGFDQYFGVVESTVLPITEDTYLQFFANNSFGIPNLKVPLSIFQEEFIVTRGNTLATFSDGTPAVVESQYESGSTLMVGSFFGLQAQSEKTCDGPTTKAIQGLMTWAGISQPISVTYNGKEFSSEVEARISIGKTSTNIVLFFMNHGSTKANYSVQIFVSQIQIPKGTIAKEIISGNNVVFVDNNVLKVDLSTSNFAVILVSLS